MKQVTYLEKDPLAAKYSFSPAVVTEGGRTVWLSGQLALRDASGADIAGQFEPQVRAIFAKIEAIMKKAGGTLADVVTMTIYVTDPRYLDRFVEIRREMYTDENFPASTFIAVSSLPFPGAIVEIQCVAVTAGPA